MNLDEIIQQHTKALPLQLQAEVFDFVLFLEQRQANQTVLTDTQRKERLRKSLDKAVALNIFAGVDGVAWQNEQRKDRNIGYDE
jgi:predicted aminopeptidase